jgi:hypothetical protein
MAFLFPALQPEITISQLSPGDDSNFFAKDRLKLNRMCYQFLLRI